MGTKRAFFSVTWDSTITHRNIQQSREEFESWLLRLTLKFPTDLFFPVVDNNFLIMLILIVKDYMILLIEFAEY